ncbi:MAG: SsrA-binding protein SmpB [Candidatus Levybacteria bacterium]|nr:SsrA-binding protein SmpB [Candidatus Levybacteria bacterium]
MKIFNKAAPSKFNVEEKFEAGIQLLGSEVKAIRLDHVDLKSAYVKLMSGEAYLINAKIFPYQYSRVEGYMEDRTRKLLLHKKELLKIKNMLDTGKYTVTPLSLYEKHGKFKLEIGVAKGKKQHERRKDLKQQAINRDQERELKNEF